MDVITEQLLEKLTWKIEKIADHLETIAENMENRQQPTEEYHIISLGSDEETELHDKINDLAEEGFVISHLNDRIIIMKRTG